MIGETDGIPECAEPGLFAVPSGDVVACGRDAFVRIRTVAGDPTLAVEVAAFDDGVAAAPLADRVDRAALRLVPVGRQVGQACVRERGGDGAALAGDPAVPRGAEVGLLVGQELGRLGALLPPDRDVRLDAVEALERAIDVLGGLVLRIDDDEHPAGDTGSVESGGRDVETVDIPGMTRRVIAEIVAGPATGIENTNVRLLKLAFRDRIGDPAHRDEPPIGLFELIEQLEIFRAHTKGMTLDPGVSIERLAELTVQFTGADIAGVCLKAGLYALRENLSAQTVTVEHFLRAVKDAVPSVTEEAEREYQKLEQVIKQESHRIGFRAGSLPRVPQSKG